jgi:hypothetical protein
MEYRDPDSAAQCDSYFKPDGHHAANAHGDLYIAANTHPHCAALAHPHADAKSDSYEDTDPFPATRTASPYRDTGAEIEVTLLSSIQDDYPI